MYLIGRERSETKEQIERGGRERETEWQKGNLKYLKTNTFSKTKKDPSEVSDNLRGKNTREWMTPARIREWKRQTEAWWGGGGEVKTWSRKMMVFSRVLEGKNNKERKKELSLSTFIQKDLISLDSGRSKTGPLLWFIIVYSLYCWVW